MGCSYVPEYSPRRLTTRLGWRATLSDGTLADLVNAAQHSTGSLGDGAHKIAVDLDVALLCGVWISVPKSLGRTAAGTRDDTVQVASGLSIMYEWYAVKRGRYPGVYGSWDEANEQVRNLSPF